LVTVLDEKGAPTKLAHTLLCAPATRMDVLTPEEQDQIVSSSSIASEYNEVIDRTSAYEMLTNKIAHPVSEENQQSPASSKNTQSTSISDTIAAVSSNPVVRQVARELTRGIFGVLFGKTSTRRR